MARTAFEQVIQLQLDKYGPAAAKKRHIQIARDILRRYLATQENKPAVTIEVDGRQASSEEQVQPYGVITYRFARMPEIGRAGKGEWVRISPKDSGDYAKSVAIFADDREVSDNAIPVKVKRLLIVATVPYARKVMVRGARIVGVPPGIAERVAQFIRRKYGAVVQVRVIYISLSSGYTLRRGRKAGRHLTYPAVEIISKFA